MSLQLIKILLISIFFVNYIESAIVLKEGSATCYTCEGESCQRVSNEKKTVACTTNDTCVAIFDGYTPIKKSCYSLLSEEEKYVCDSYDDISCYKCNVTNCNHLGRLDHKCAQCSSKDDSNCVDKPSKWESRCDAPKSDNAYCYTYKNESGTIRGCANTNRDIADCLEQNTTCTLCHVSKYNTILSACNSFPSSSIKNIPNFILLIVTPLLVFCKLY